ncbi:MAG: NB-ARC domain-containing protein [Leptolyngbyaceae cyanobacterium]
MPHESKSSLSTADDGFVDAANNWDLERLYFDLAEAKGRGLTPVEKRYLRGVLCCLSPNEIAVQAHVAGDTVRNYLSRGLYRYIETLLIKQEHPIQRVKDWSRVPQLLETLGYRLSEIIVPPEPTADPPPSPDPGPATRDSSLDLADVRQWQGIPNTSVFYGRDKELAELHQWIQRDRCHLVALIGIGGIGKTTLAAKLTEQLQDQFDVLVWRSLQNPGPIESFLTDILSVLDPHGTLSPEDEPYPTISSKIQQVMTSLHCQRCLLVLEDIQLILQRHELAGQYESGFEAYGTLLQRIGEESHQSCLILTGWEKPKEVARLEGQNRPVRSMRVKGLDQGASEILAEQGLQDKQIWDDLIMAYRGNPLALKIIAATIKDLFGGSVTEFLDQNTFYLGDFTYLLYKQFERLSSLEREIMAILAQGSPLELGTLRQAIATDTSTSDTLKALESLGRRSLIEKVATPSGTQFTLQPMMMKYVRRHSSS